MVRQGYVTSEPFAVERAGGFAPNVFLLADHGFDGYSTTIEVNRALIDEEPELVDCLVNASIEGWYSYLYGDPQAAHFLIQSDNPDISIELLEHARAAMIEHGIVDSGLTETAGIGAIDPERFTAFYAAMHEAGIIEEEIDPSTAFDARFVNQGHGLELRDRLRAEAEAN